MNKGICVAGHLCVDIIYPCETYPREGELAVVCSDITRTTGGAVNNTGMDLARLDPKMKVLTSGCIGPDPEGDYIVERLQAYPNIDTSFLRRTGHTGCTAVMTNEATKTRTFFQFCGANALYSEDYIDLDAVKESADILHIGYILILPALDAPDPEYGTKMARLLKNAREKGLRTSIDVVSETGGRMAKLVPPALRYTDYCVINEVEAQCTTGIPLRGEDGALIRANLLPALKALRGFGVRRWAVIHAPELCAGLSEDDTYTELPSLKLPEGYIRGTTGAGDAFCAGVLTGAERELPLPEAMKLGICSAAASLGHESSTLGVGTAEENLKLYDRYSAE